MDDASTLYGAASIVIGAVASVIVALVSRPHPKTSPEIPQASAPDVAQDDERLATVEGIAQILVQQGHQIAELQRGQAHDRDTIGALRRYVRALRGAMQSAGVPVPEPAPEDAPLVSG